MQVFGVLVNAGKIYLASGCIFARPGTDLRSVPIEFRQNLPASGYIFVFWHRALQSAPTWDYVCRSAL